MFLIFVSCNKIQKEGNSKFVNTLIGTGGHGHTFPGVVLPFGMVQLSPDTRLEGWDGCSGYHYSDSIIYGFSHTHLSGTGCSDLCDILLMPTTGKVHVYNGSQGDYENGYCSSFSHNHEIANAGYYCVTLKKYNINVELTATNRVGIHKYNFPASSNSNIIIDLQHRDKVLDSYVKFNGNDEIEGYRRSEGWAKNQVVYFVIKFSKPFINYGIVKDDVNSEKKSTEKGTNIKAFVNFNTKDFEPVIVKVAISGVSIDGARKNMKTEASSWDFDYYKKAAISEWDKKLSKIEVKGDAVKKKIFYTALYHSYISPNIFSDIDGRYYGIDNKIHKVKNKSNYYTVFSLWDTYRALHPLMTILEPTTSNDFINTFISQYEQIGKLPVWELYSNETNCMIGYHAVSVIFDAWKKGINGFDSKKALEAMIKTANINSNDVNSYKKNGSILVSDAGESVSKTLEYSYDDWCIAMFAKSIKNKKIYKEYIERAQYYNNLFDDSLCFMRAKINGGFINQFKANEVNFHYTEANSWQYSFYVPQDISNLIKLHGGRQNISNMLDSLFYTSSHTTGRTQADITGLIGQYAHGNEPSHHIAYLYNFVGEPYKTQEIIHKIENEFYKDSPDGLIGNEDCGQMSAWYVFSAMGFYPVTPGSNDYIIGTPLFDTIAIKLENGKVFKIIAKNLSNKNYYIKAIKLNNKPYNKSFIKHSDIVNGGTLEFEMSSTANKNFAKSESDCPSTNILENKIVATPYIINSDYAFYENKDICLHDVNKTCKIYYTLDGSDPNANSLEYKNPFKIVNSAQIKAIAIDNLNNVSKTMNCYLHKIPKGLKIKIYSIYNPQYSAGGDIALIDGVRGNNDFKTGCWQGYQDTDLTAVIDIGKEVYINKIGAGFLQDIGPWILFPPYIEFYTSTNGKTFKYAGIVKNITPRNDWTATIKDFVLEIKKTKTRYIKVYVKKPGVLPEWHPGAGNPAFFFIDEVFYE